MNSRVIAIIGRLISTIISYIILPICSSRIEVEYKIRAESEEDQLAVGWSLSFAKKTSEGTLTSDNGFHHTFKIPARKSGDTDTMARDYLTKTQERVLDLRTSKNK